jgi:hypothetical protein
VATNDVVVARTTQNAIAGLPANQDVVAVVAANEIRATVVRVLRVDGGPGEWVHRPHVGRQHQGRVKCQVERQQRCVDFLLATELVLRLDLAVVAKDQVVAVIAADCVSSRTAQHHVVVGTGNNCVATAIVGRISADDVNVQRIDIPKRGQRNTLLQNIIDKAVVAQHDIHAGTGVDNISSHAAHNDVTSA